MAERVWGLGASRQTGKKKKRGEEVEPGEDIQVRVGKNGKGEKGRDREGKDKKVNTILLVPSPVFEMTDLHKKH